MWSISGERDLKPEMDHTELIHRLFSQESENEEVDLKTRTRGWTKGFVEEAYFQGPDPLIRWVHTQRYNPILVVKFHGSEG
jgi:hypothetical protein